MKVSNILWGIVLIIVGVVFGLNALDLVDINLFFAGWWTLFIIVPCFIGLFKEESKTGNIIGIFIGVALLLGCQEVLDFNFIWKLIVPFIMVMIGLSIIFKDAFKEKFSKEIKKLNKKNMKEYCSTFGGQTVEFAGEEFTGCSISAVFGAVKCDLRDAIIKEDVVIETSAIFGGITIIVPDNVKVKVSSTPIFGGVSDERKKKNKTGEITIYINALSMFGGVEIK